MKVWALVPARGGSKSIPYKNITPLAGEPLLGYGVRAVQAVPEVERIICSTEDDKVAEYAEALGIEVDKRPLELAEDDSHVADMAREWLDRCQPDELPDLLLLVQPTSPFLLPEHVSALIDSIAQDNSAKAGMTATPVYHNHHAWNQRVLEKGHIRFVYPEERSEAYNKQRKPTFYSFGNLVAVRPASLYDAEGFFPEQSAYVEIPRPYDMDVDKPEDLAIAEAFIAAGIVELPHMNNDGQRPLC